MEAKDYQEIINTADCNAEVNFVDADEQLQIMGWAKILIETAYKAGIREVVEWIQNTGNWVCIDKTKEQWEIIRKEWQVKLKEWGIEWLRLELT